MNNTQKKIKVFFDKGKTVRYKKHQTFLHAGDIPQGVNYVKKGYVRLYSISAEGKELTLVIYQPGDFFPVVWGLKEQSSIYYFESMTPVELSRISRLDFVEFLNANTDVFMEFVDHILIRFQTSLKRMEYLTFGNSFAKVASAFMRLSERFGETEKDRVIIKVPLAHKDVASLVGVTRETATIEINKLRNKGLIGNKKGQYYIKDLPGLRKESLLSD